MRACWIALASSLVWTASVASAQTVVINPTGVAFVASANHHDTLVIDNQPIPVLTRYELRIYLDGATSPTTRVDLGKPVPDATGEILVRPTELIGLPLGAFRATVAAIGPGGEAESTPTAPFARMAPPVAPTAVRVVSP